MIKSESRNKLKAIYNILGSFEYTAHRQTSLTCLLRTSRPKFLANSPGRGCYCNPLGLDSPDIFQLRAPLVSCENILTPGISADLVLAKQI